MNPVFERRIALGYSVVLVALVAIVIMAFQNASVLVRTNQRLTALHQFATELDAIVMLLSDAESGQRSYLVTGDERYLEPYLVAQATVDQRLAHLAALGAHDPAHAEQIAALEPLVQTRLARLQTGIAIRRSEGLDAVREYILTGNDRALAGEIRAILGAMSAEETRQIDQQIEAATGSGRTTPIAFALITALAGVSLISSHYFFRREIQARQEAAASAAAYAEEIRDLYDYAPCGYHALDERGNFVRINATELGWLGYTGDEVLGKLSFADVVAPMSRVVFQDRYACFLKAGTIDDLELEMARKDGSTFTAVLSATALRDAGGAFLRCRSTLFDITDRRQAEAQERRTQALMRQMIEVMPLGVWLLDEAGNVTLDNPAGRRIWDGDSTSSGAGVDDRARTHQGRRVRSGNSIAAHEWSGVRAIAQGETTINEEIEIECFDGARRAILSSAVPLHDDQQVIGAVVINLDVTPQKAADAEIRRLNEDLERRARDLAAVNRELEAFSYSVSHDLRAPLRSIHGFSTALLEDYAAAIDDPGRDFLHRIRNASQRMAQLIDDLLGLSRVTRAELNRQTIDLTQMALSIVDELRAGQPERNVRVEIRPDLTVNADPHLVRVVLANLLGNAWKFTAKRPDALIQVGANAENGERVFFVRDNGAGFDMTYADKLFGAFQRLHRYDEFEGTGVGLATVQRIVHRHGGRIWAQAAVNAGAEFRFTLGA
jgi:PAS domain S-box-containing protein